MFAGFADFAFYRMTLKGAHLVAGFGRIVDLKPADLLTDLTRRRSAGGGRARGHRAYERRSRRDLPALCDQAPGRARRRLALRRLRSGGARAADASAPRLRLPFPQRVTQPGVLRAVLKQMADEARAA